MYEQTQINVCVCALLKSNIKPFLKYLSCTTHWCECCQSSLLETQRPPGRTHLYITHCTRYHFKISAHINKMILPGKSPNRKPDSFYNRKKNNTFTYSVTHTHADAHTHCTILHPSPGLRADSFVKVSRRGEGEWHCGTESSHRTLR